MAQLGAKVPGNTLTTNFSNARNKTDIDWGGVEHQQRFMNNVHSQKGCTSPKE